MRAGLVCSLFSTGNISDLSNSSPRAWNLPQNPYCPWFDLIISAFASSSGEIPARTLFSPTRLPHHAITSTMPFHVGWMDNLKVSLARSARVLSVDQHFEEVPSPAASGHESAHSQLASRLGFILKTVLVHVASCLNGPCIFQDKEDRFLRLPEYCLCRYGARPALICISF